MELGQEPPLKRHQVDSSQGVTSPQTAQQQQHQDDNASEAEPAEQNEDGLQGLLGLISYGSSSSQSPSLNTEQEEVSRKDRIRGQEEVST